MRTLYSVHTAAATHMTDHPYRDTRVWEVLIQNLQLIIVTVQTSNRHHLSPRQTSAEHFGELVTSGVAVCVVLIQLVLIKVILYHSFYQFIGYCLTISNNSNTFSPLFALHQN